MRPQWHPDCIHAEHRGRLAPVVCDFHRCGVRGRDIYEPGDCDGCPSRQPLPRQEEGETMPRVGFWDKVEPDSGRKYIDLARELRAAGTSYQQIEQQLGGPKNTVRNKLNARAASAPQQAQEAASDAVDEAAPAAPPEAPQKPVAGPLCYTVRSLPDGAPVLSRAGDPDLPDHEELTSFLEEMGMEKRWNLWRSAWRAARLRYEQAG